MSDCEFFRTRPTREHAAIHIVDRFKESLLLQQLGTTFPNQGDLTLVTTSTIPKNLDYFSDYSMPSCTPWLVNEVANYCKQSPNAVVICEDMVSLPSDPYILTHEHPPFWQYREKLFWPVGSMSVRQFPVEEVIAWSNAPIVAGFVFLQVDGLLPLNTRLLSLTEFEILCLSMTKLVTQVFDGGGWLVWEKTVGQKPTPE